ncbi:MAG TPA: DUF4430 domain-containing protein [Mobilitalea sp.]|nr:DUF4430 domain-containing protein [Mobilitalea sp.]
MRNNLFFKLLLIIICFILLLTVITGVICVDASETKVQYTADDLEKIIDNILTLKQEESQTTSLQKYIDASLSKSAGTSPCDWYIITLHQYKERYNYNKYRKALDIYIKNTKIANATDMQRIALVYSAVGGNEEYIQTTIDNSIGDLGIMSYIYGLILLDTKSYTSKTYSRENLITKILSLRFSDGGWALTGKVSDIDVTAMALQALAPYYDDEDVSTAVDKALTLLSERQLKSGDYYSYNNRSCESVAQVILALCSLHIDFQKDERFIKEKHTLLDGLLLYALPDGSFSHTIDGLYNDTATVQAMNALVATWRQLNDYDAIFTFSDDELKEELTNSQESTNSIKKIKITYKDTQHSILQNSDKKEIGIAIILFTLTLILGLLFLHKKLNRKNILLLLILTGVSIVVLWNTDFQTAKDYYQVNTDKIEVGNHKVYVSIRCDAVVDKKAADYIPSDGIILEKTEYKLYDGDSVFDILLRVTQQNKIQLEYHGSDNNSIKTVYVKGMNQLYEYDFGELSGWMYRVNSEFPGVGCADYYLSDGDIIEWFYTCDLGKDISE